MKAFLLHKINLGYRCYLNVNNHVRVFSQRLIKNYIQNFIIIIRVLYQKLSCQKKKFTIFANYSWPEATANPIIMSRREYG